MLWYPVKGDPKTRVAPDVLVAFGRPKGDRGSYRTWEEENVAPQVVFEILSPGNTTAEMAEKLRFYERYGVEEYYLLMLRSHLTPAPSPYQGEGERTECPSPKLGEGLGWGA